MGNTIWCVGKNYPLHALEMNQRPESSPVIFCKSYNSLVMSDQTVHLPTFSKQVQYEVELAFLFSESLKLSHITVALDLTARDIQNEIKKKGLPWTTAKSFKQSCPLGKWKEYHPQEQIHFHLTVNDLLRQKGNSKDMIFPIEELRTYIIEHFPVCPGDILITGTPEGISDIAKEDIAKLYLNDEIVGQFLFT